MGGGNGAKAKHAREKAQKGAGKEAKSQLKSNAAAKTLKCKACFQDFQSTARRAELETHASSRHNKTYEDCFPAA